MQTSLPKEARDGFRAILGYVQGFYAIMGEWGTPVISIFVYALGAAESAPTVSELASLAGENLKTASRVLKVLRQRGLIELFGDAEDTRERRVRLTPAGLKVLTLIHRAMVDMAGRIADASPRPGLRLRTRRSA